MLKEIKGLEYALEVIKAFHTNPGEHDSKTLAQLVGDNGAITPSTSYLAKILPRMKKAGILVSSEHGYQLTKPVDQISIENVLKICQMPDENSPLYQFCEFILTSMEDQSIIKIYDFDPI
jgi:DNA-binding IscR family transcriptional regulator